MERWFSGDESSRVLERGKHRGRPLLEVARIEPDYPRWMLRPDDMDEEVLEIVREALERSGS